MIGRNPRGSIPEQIQEKDQRETAESDSFRKMATKQKYAINSRKEECFK